MIFIKLKNLHSVFIDIHLVFCYTKSKIYSRKGLYMKNIFGLNKTLYSEMGSEEFDGASFISRSLSSDIEAEENQQPELPRLPVFLTVIQYLCVAAFAVGLGIWVASGTPMSELIKSSVYIPVLLAGGFLGFIVISVIDMINSKKFAKDHGIENMAELAEYGEIHEYDEEAEEAEAAKVKAELGIPEDALDMDFLSFFYREDEDGPFPIKPFDFMTMEMFAFADGDLLNVADFNDVYSISKSDIGEIEKVEKETTLLGWSKEESYDSDKYAELGIKENEEGFIVVPYYYSVKIGEEFEIVLPPYEIDAFKALIG